MSWILLRKQIILHTFFRHLSRQYSIRKAVWLLKKPETMCLDKKLNDRYGKREVLLMRRRCYFKPRTLNAFCTCADTRHNAVNGNRYHVKIRSKRSGCFLSPFLPLSSGNTRVMGALPSCTGFFTAKFALIRHNSPFLCDLGFPNQ